jgi:hypothetical protein
MFSCVSEGLLDQYLREQEYSPAWSRILSALPSDDDEYVPHQPGMRGGHQMCIDPHADTIFLFGGWDGTQDLSDLWQYHVPTNQWTKLSSNTESQVRDKYNYYAYSHLLNCVPLVINSSL